VRRQATKIPRRFLGSVFTKLLAVILLTGLGIHLAVGAFFWYFRHEAGREYHQALTHYLALVVSEIGNPPDFERAAALAGAGSFHLRYTAPDRSWSTREEVPYTLPARMRTFQPQPGVRAGFSRGRILVEYQQGRGKFIFEIGSAAADFEVATPIILLLVVVSLILGAAYFCLRRILKPIAWLKDGVLQVGSGNLDHRIPLRRSDEFRDLAQAFNEMAQRIAEMLRSREQLMLDVSHELRSPLTRLKLALEFLPEDPAKESIREDVAEMEAMTAAILENARIRHQQGKLERAPMALSQVVKDSLLEFENHGPGVRIIALPPDIVCRINPELIRTVVKNLVTNAMNHSPPGSLPIEIHLERQPPFAILRVMDHGTGIAPEDLPNIFEPFYRADRSRSRRTGGYGLGLSLCKAVIEAHGGRIRVESELHSGTTVTIALPLSDG
jgi:signal transduction histidine kinase